jgi:Ser/Thr protein kinase RdoA (MazF antagonist)
MTNFYDWSTDRQIAALGDLAQVALRQYQGSFAEPTLIKYRENAIFKVEREDGAVFALRIHRYGYHSDAALTSELAWMSALASSGVAMPTIMRNHAGDMLTFAQSASIPERRQIDMLSWLDGLPLAVLEQGGTLSSEQRCAHYRKVGALLATLHDQAATWRRPPDFSRPNWFTDALVGENPNWGRFWELKKLTSGERALVTRARDSAAAALASLPQTAQNSGLIHADLLADNVIIDGTQVRPIDFDDCGFGWHLFDLATAIYFTRDDADHDGLKDALISGYRAVRPLTDGDLAALPLFLLLRATTYLGWVSTRAETPTARELAPMLIERCCREAEDFLVLQ